MRCRARAIAVLAAGAAFLLLAGCTGGGGSTDPYAPSPTAGFLTGAPTPSGPPPTPVQLSANATSKLSRVPIAAVDIGADAVPTQETNISLEVAAAYFPDDPAAKANLESWGFLGGHAQTFRSQGTNVTVLVQAFDTAGGAHAAFSAFSQSASGLPSSLQSNDKVTVSDVQHSVLTMPPLGDEVYGSETSTTLTAKQLHGQSVKFSVRSVVFRKGDLMVSLTSTPALAAGLLIAAAQQIAAKA